MVELQGVCGWIVEWFVDLQWSWVDLWQGESGLWHWRGLENREELAVVVVVVEVVVVVGSGQ